MESLQELRQQKDKAIMKVFWLAFSLALVFGIPALLGSLLGRYLDTRFASGYVFTIGVLVVTCALSWIIVIRWYRSVKKTLATINAKIARLEEEQKDTN